MTGISQIIKVMYLISKGLSILVTAIVAIKSQGSNHGEWSGWKLQKFSLMTVYRGMLEVINTSTKRK